MSADARQLKPTKLGDLIPPSKSDDAMVPCADCGADTLCPGFIVDMTREFNHQLHVAGTPKDDLIKRHEVVCCDACRVARERKRETESNRDHRKARRLLLLAKGGEDLDTEDVAWLHVIGSGDTLNTVLANQKRLTARKDGER